MDPHYFFPPARAYPLNRFLFALKSDDAVRARYLGDPEATLREAELDAEAAAALRADRVIVMEHGRAVEQGAPDELASREGAFARWVAAARALIARLG